MNTATNGKDAKDIERAAVFARAALMFLRRYGEGVKDEAIRVHCQRAEACLTSAVEQLRRIENEREDE